MSTAAEGLGSAAAAAARVAELQAMIARASGAAPQGGAAPAGSFDAQLASASAVAAPASAGASSLGPPAGAPPYAAQIEAAASRYGLDPALLTGLIRAESNFDPDAGSPAGAQGLTQLMPETARSLGVADPHDPEQAIDGGARLLSEDLREFGGDPELALAAYNAGAGAVHQYDGIPPYPETQAYVKRVLEYAAQYRQGAFQGLAG